MQRKINPPLISRRAFKSVCLSPSEDPALWEGLAHPPTPNPIPTSSSLCGGQPGVSLELQAPPTHCSFPPREVLSISEPAGPEARAAEGGRQCQVHQTRRMRTVPSDRTGLGWPPALPEGLSSPKARILWAQPQARKEVDKYFRESGDQV